MNRMIRNSLHLLALAGFLVALSSCNSNTNGGFFGGGSNGNGIVVTVSNVPTGDPCETNLYAVTYSDFDTKADAVQVQLLNSGTGTWSGILPVAASTVDASVFVYCDASQGDFTYDSDGTGTQTSVPFSNTAVFNACSRTADILPVGTSTAYTYPTGAGYFVYDFFAGYSNPRVTPTEPYYLDAGLLGTAGDFPGDSFALRIASFGDSVAVDLTDLAALSSTAHPDAGGTVTEWCGCLTAIQQYNTMAYQSYNTSSSSYYGLLVRVFGTGLFYFTDTDRLSASGTGTCILP